MSAEIVLLSDHRPPTDDDLAFDLLTAVDVAIRDLREIQQFWGSEAAHQRARECETMLRRVLLASRH